MFYNAELCFVRESFAKSRLKTRIVALKDVPTVAPTFDKNSEIGDRDDLFWLREYLKRAEKRNFYRLSDSFSCTYVFVLLPEYDEKTFLIVGPYFTSEQTTEKLLEKAEQVGMSHKLALQLKDYYSGIPYIPEASPIFAMLDSLGDVMFRGPRNFTLVDIDREKVSSPSPITVWEDRPEEDMDKQRDLMEKRYARENELMQAVSLGLVNKAEMLFADIKSFSFEQRLADPVRNLKNYGIIMNTLLRKAAEQGGVHPLYLDSVSSDFAQKIEQVLDVIDIQKLMSEMFRSYCRLVRKHSMKDYSPPIQRTIILIDSDLSADLTLSTLAKAQGVSPSYLSALFHREVGTTLTDFVNGKRVKLAMQLLKTTSLQVQTIAAHCGIVDVHYFSRIFKKYSGTTPKAYRDSN